MNVENGGDVRPSSPASSPASSLASSVKSMFCPCVVVWFMLTKHYINTDKRDVTLILTVFGVALCILAFLFFNVPNLPK